MKASATHRKKNRPISLAGMNSGKGKSIPNPQSLQLIRLEEQVQQSSQVKKLAQFQAKADRFSSQRYPLQLGRKDRKFKNDASEFTPSKEAKVHVHEYPVAQKKIKGHLNLGGTHIKVNSYISAADALKTLQTNPGVPGYDEMICLLKSWLEELSPTVAKVKEDQPVKKKNEDKSEAEKQDGDE